MHHRQWHKKEGCGIGSLKNGKAASIYRARALDGSAKLPKSGRALQKKIDSYFEIYLKESGEIADIESLADYLGITRDSFLLLTADEKYGGMLKSARNRIAKIKKQLAFCGKIPAAVLSFDLKNNHGYRDKPEDIEQAGSEAVVFNGKAAEWAE